MVFTPEFIGIACYKIIIEAAFLAMEYVKYTALAIRFGFVIFAACQTLSKGKWPVCRAFD